MRHTKSTSVRSVFRLGLLGLRRSGVAILFRVSRCENHRFRTFERSVFGLRESPGEDLGRNSGSHQRPLPYSGPRPHPILSCQLSAVSN